MGRWGCDEEEEDEEDEYSVCGGVAWAGWGNGPHSISPAGVGRGVRR